MSRQYFVRCVVVICRAWNLTDKRKCSQFSSSSFQPSPYNQPTDDLMGEELQVASTLPTNWLLMHFQLENIILFGCEGKLEGKAVWSINENQHTSRHIDNIVIRKAWHLLLWPTDTFYPYDCDLQTKWICINQQSPLNICHWRNFDIVSKMKR